MVDEVWLHIGAPKTGTSNLQKRFAADRKVLAEQGLAYLTPPGKNCCNDLAFAVKRNRSDLRDMAGALNREIEIRPEPRAVISSEMLYGVPPDILLNLMPALAARPLNVLAYLRRQDRFIEAMFLQKSKNGRFFGSIASYIKRFQGSGSDFQAMLAPWEQAGGDVTLVPRVLEPGQLTGGDVVSDAFSLIGLPAPQVDGEARVNVSPGLHRVQILQVAARLGVVNPRRLQRELSAKYPQKPAERAPILSQAERREFVARYAAGNEALRARYFPHADTLFDMSGLEGETPPQGIAPFTDAQLMEVQRLMEVIEELR
ncbi:MAG: hypothetical protein GY717_20140 [Rhodobacteraceae bacterium]|nr:hypothetical protein [Paracoccaceae bacterium]